MYIYISRIRILKKLTESLQISYECHDIAGSLIILLSDLLQTIINDTNMTAVQNLWMEAPLAPLTNPDDSVWRQTHKTNFC